MPQPSTDPCKRLNDAATEYGKLMRQQHPRDLVTAKATQLFMKILSVFMLGYRALEKKQRDLAVENVQLKAKLDAVVSEQVEDAKEITRLSDIIQYGEDEPPACEVFFTVRAASLFRGKPPYYFQKMFKLYGLRGKWHIDHVTNCFGNGNDFLSFAGPGGQTAEIEDLSTLWEEVQKGDCLKWRMQLDSFIQTLKEQQVAADSTSQ